MIDVITKPSIQEIHNKSQITLVTTSDIRPPQCFHADCFYLCTTDLCFFKTFPLDWTKESQLPFQKRQGQSMTSTPSGIAFFGGQNELVVYNDLWLYDKGVWSYVTCDIPARANHAAACDKYGRLVICGGTTENQVVLHDLYVIDLKTQKVKELKIPDLPPVSYEHSLTLLPDGTFVLFGGEMKLSDDNKVKSFEHNMYILDLEKKTVKKIKTDFQLNIDTHFTAVIYGMLFVFGSSDRNVWMFNFDHQVWIPFSLPTFNNVQFKPYYVFSSFSFTEHKCIHLVSEDFTKLATVPVFGEPPPVDPFELKNHPHFIYFLRTNLVNGHNYFNKYEPTTEQVLPQKRVILDQIRTKFRQKNSEVKVVPDKSVENIFKLIDTLNAMEYLLLHANKVQKLMEYTSNNINLDLSTDKEKEKISLSQFTENQLNELISVHQVIIDIQNLIMLRAKELKPLNEQCESLIREIENATFFAFCQQKIEEKNSEEPTENKESPLVSFNLDSEKEKKKKKKSTPIDVKRQSRHEKKISRHGTDSYTPSKHSHSTTFEQLAEDSKQLAHAISYERIRYENELKNQSMKESNFSQIISPSESDAVLNVLDQLCSVSQREINFMSQLRPVCYQFFDVLSDLTKLRESELMIDDDNTRSLSSSLSRSKMEEKVLIHLKDQLDAAYKDLNASIDEVATIGNNNKSHADEPPNSLRKMSSLDSHELLGNEEVDDDELMFVSKQKLRLENQIQLQKPLKKVEKSISKIGNWLKNADPAIGTKSTRELVNSTINSFKGNINERLLVKSTHVRTPSSLEVPKFRDSKKKVLSIPRAVSDSIYSKNKENSSSNYTSKSVSDESENYTKTDEDLSDFVTPFDVSQGNELIFADDLEKVFTRIEENIYLMNPLSSI